MATHYRQLVAWQRAMELVEEVYRITRRFPEEEMFGLTNQLRRAAVSIPSNTAEGQGRGIGAEFAHHLRISNGSRQEVETQLLIAERLVIAQPGDVAVVLAKAEETGRLLRGLHRAVNR